MEWKRKPPDSEGWWLRVNIGERPDVYHVARNIRTGVLETAWGFNEATKVLTVMHPKMKGWLWAKIPPWDGPAFVRNTVQGA